MNYLIQSLILLLTFHSSDANMMIMMSVVITTNIAKIYMTVNTFNHNLVAKSSKD
jgi:hypothetical protein